MNDGFNVGECIDIELTSSLAFRWNITFPERSNVLVQGNYQFRVINNWLNTWVTQIFDNKNESKSNANKLLVSSFGILHNCVSIETHICQGLATEPVGPEVFHCNSISVRLSIGPTEEDFCKVTKNKRNVSYQRGMTQEFGYEYRLTPDIRQLSYIFIRPPHRVISENLFVI